MDDTCFFPDLRIIERSSRPAVRSFGYGLVVDTFQTLLNTQGVNMILEKQDYIGLQTDRTLF
jgi:hypothetical protein